MKKIILALTVIIFVFAVTGCSSGGGGEHSASVKKFWAMDTRDPDPLKIKFYQIDAQLLAENTRCEVWVEQGSDADKGTAQSIANTFSGSIYNKMMDNFDSTIIDGGKRYNVLEFAHYVVSGESQGKFTILLLDIKDSYQKGVNDSYVAGYFYPVDLFDQSTANSMQGSPKTNQRVMIYLDTNPGLQYIDEIYGTLAHEMQHLMNFVSSIAYRSPVSGGVLYITQMDTWIDEGLSSAAEYIYYETHPNAKIQWYNEVKDKSGLLSKGNNFFMWDNRRSESNYAVLDDYATVYLFFQWLRLQSSKDIYKDIIKSPHKNHEAVTAALNAKIGGKMYNNWYRVLEDWLAANYIQSSDGPYGYRGDSDLNSLKKHYAPTGSTSISLYPGEGVYSYVASISYNIPTSGINIKYLGLTDKVIPSGDPINSTGALLTYNADTDIEGDIKTGTVTNTAPSVGIAKSVSGYGRGITSTSPFPIGIRDELRRKGSEADFNITGLKILKEAADE